MEILYSKWGYSPISWGSPKIKKTCFLALLISGEPIKITSDSLLGFAVILVVILIVCVLEKLLTLNHECCLLHFKHNMI